MWLFVKEKAVFCLAVVLFLAWSLPAATSEQLPKRFLSEDGEDKLDCLTDTTGKKPCRSLPYALGNQTITGLEVLLYPGVYDYGPAVISVIEFQTLSIAKVANSSGVVVFRCSFLSDTEFGDLSLINGRNFTIRGITVQECGTRSSGIFVRNTTNVLVSNCTFRNNSGGALTLYRNRDVLVEKCLFMDNIGLHANAHHGLFLASIPGPPQYLLLEAQTAGGLAIIIDSTANATATVQDCQFYRNRASVNELDKDDPRPHAYVVSGSGGALIFRLLGTENARIVVENCIFSNNSAKYSGGGIYVPILSQSRNNSALINNCSFDSNRANEYGGGIYVDVFSVQENNSVVVNNSFFRNDYAGFCGGGVAIFEEDTLSVFVANSNNILTIVNCTFDKNECPDGGSAVGMISRSRVDQPILLTSMKDCVFTNNDATTDGTILVIRFGALFEGTNTLTNNSGGGVVLVLARMESKGNLWFQGNTAKHGAGISMQDRCLLNLHLDTNITFLENKADLAGGALQQRQTANHGRDRRQLSLFNTFCFIQYQVEDENSITFTPLQWRELGNVNVSFINNTAGHAGAALYVSDVRQCSFTAAVSRCQQNNSTNATVYDSSIFPGPPFTFRNNQVVGRAANESFVPDAATDPDNFTVDIEPNFNEKVSMMAAPGDKITFVIKMFDQNSNRREGIWGFRLSDVHRANITHGEMFLQRSTIEYYSVSDVAPKRHPVIIKAVQYPEDTCQDTVVERETDYHEVFQFFIIQAQSGEIISEKNITIGILCCHPGYHYNSSDGTNGTCVLTSNPHFLRSDQSNRYIYLRLGYYAGFYNDTSTGQAYFSVALLPTVFQSCLYEINRLGCLYAYDRPDEQCVNDRRGYMCGKCKENKGVDMTLRACKTCNAWDTVILTIICVLILVFSAIVLVFNIGVPNDLKGFLFYAQVVGFAYLNGAQNSWDFHLSRFLGFSLYLPICPFTSLPALWTAAFGFLPSILATFTVIAYIMCARVIKPLSQRAAFRGIWLLSLFVYKFTADTIANIIKCVKIEAEGSRNYVVYYYDGNVQCYTGQHLILAVPSILLFVVVVILGPAFVILISFKRYKITQPFTDVITEGIKTKHRWWSGFDLLRRLLFVFVVTHFDIFWPAYTQLAVCLSTLVVLAVLCATKPYEKTWINFIEGFILLDLLFIAIQFLNEEEYTNPSSTKTFNFFAIGFLLLPFIYAFVNITLRILCMIWRKYMPINAVKLTEYITQRLQPQKAMGKPLLKGQRSFDLPEPTQTSYSGEVYGELDSIVPHDHPDVDYSQLREELLESYN